MEEQDRNKNLKLEIVGDDYQEIMNTPPSWVVRCGIIAIFIFIVGILVASWFIKYPDIISSRIIITSNNPPVQLISKLGGEIDTFYVKENDIVKKGQILACIRSSAKSNDVLKLKKILLSLENILFSTDSVSNINFSERLILGEIQSAFSSFVQRYQLYQLLKNNNYYADKIKIIEQQLEEHNASLLNYTNLKNILEKEFELVELKSKKDKQLFEEKVISELEFNQSKGTYLQKKYTLENANQNIINSTIQISEYHKVILDLKNQMQQNTVEALTNLQESYKQLVTQLNAFEQQYFFIAPIDGKVAAYEYWNTNQNVKGGDVFLSIVPSYSKLFGKALLPIFKAGKVKLNQKVKIKIDDYEFSEFGMLEGNVESISYTSKNNNYYVNISLPKGLTTSYKKQLEYKQEMQGSAEIITEDLRLLERFFNKLKTLAEKKPKDS